MKRILSFIVAVTFAGQAWAVDNYDFSAVCSSGQTLYYKIKSETEVEVTYPKKSGADYYSGYTKPSGNMVIPDAVTNPESKGTTYTVTSIGGSAFESCIGLTEVVIPYSVTSIGPQAIRDCSGLTSVIIGNSVKSIGSQAFFRCSNLISATIPNSVTSIDNSAFAECSGLTSVTIGNSVTSIGDYAFQNCSGLTSVTISNSVTYIGNYAFSGCIDLTSVTIPNSVTMVRPGAFYECSGLTSVTIPNSVTSISLYAFYGCIGLTSVTIPNSVTSIDYSAFFGCSGLTSICYEGSNEPTYQSTSFKNVDKTIPVCVPIDYSLDTWCGFTNLYKGHDIVTDPATVTCTEAGLSEGKHCSKCGKVITAQAVVSALGHSYGVPTYEWTEDGSACTATSICQRDETHVATEDATITSEETIAATCGEMGTTTYTATFENEPFTTQTKDVVDIPATGHSYSTTVTAPTCTAVGYTTHTCSVCENTYYSDTVAAKGHTAVVDAAVPATCTAAGKTEGKHCSVCNETIVAQTEIAALGHEFKDYVYNNDATTAADGTETAICTRGCGATDTKVAEGTKLPEKVTAVSDEAANAVSIYAHNNIIVVENATDEISVYNAMGKLVCKDVTPCVRIEIPVTAPGVYIVKTGSVVKRVMVN
ncbi:MAG: leucine-rich repeat domain-containing protein [Salinivirgaceae bacterium]|nr:leucine-rich repeat domain-containing protein [Salinivirgaceae bacterium]